MQGEERVPRVSLECEGMWRHPLGPCREKRMGLRHDPYVPWRSFGCAVLVRRPEEGSQEMRKGGGRGRRGDGRDRKEYS